MSPRRTAVVEKPLALVWRPEKLVEPHEELYGGNIWIKARMAIRLLVFYFSNVVLYAAPLTAAGFGTIGGSIEVPGLLAPVLNLLAGDAVAGWRFILTLGQNSLFLFVATILTLVTFHIGVILSRSSEGLLLTVRTVTYSTGIYLATIFTLVWYLSTGSAIATADEFLIAIQSAFIYFFIDLLGADLALPAGRPEAIPTTGFSMIGMVVLLLLLLAAIYYLYVLYLGARITHGASIFDSLVAVGFVILSPAIYVFASILSYQLFSGAPI